MMIKVLVLLGFALLADAQQYVNPRVSYSDNSAPTPYQFSYTAPAIGGSSSHQESGDGNGRVTGSYTVNDDDGRSRIVEYIADEGGFRASISTNEPGTANQNPADVSIVSSADDGHSGTHVHQATPVAVAPVPVRIAPPPAPLPIRAQTLVPIQPAIQPAFFPAQPALFPAQPALFPAQPALFPAQPALFPAQPALFPAQPALFPVQPQLIAPRQFISPPALFPLDAGRYVPGPALLPFDSRRVIGGSALVPIQDNRVIPDPFFDGGSFFRPFERRVLV